MYHRLITLVRTVIFGSNFGGYFQLLVGILDKVMSDSASFSVCFRYPVV